jgi:hypothetical protein
MDIIGYPNYLIYDDGRVWSKKTKKFLSQSRLRDGYIRYCLYNNKKSKQYSAHILVAEHYIPNPNNYKTIDHIDRCRTNNNISNLRWASHIMQNNNRNIRYDNKSGHMNIGYNNTRNKWEYKYKNKFKRFNNKIDAICYKFIHRLMVRRHQSSCQGL